MADHDGSRWYFPVFEGLVEAKHCRQMGPSVWLYLYLLSRAWVARQGGVVMYNHPEAAEALGMAEREVKRWFRKLQETGYINTRARRSHHLEVEIANWRTLEEWLDSREREGDRPFLSLHNESSDKRSDMSRDSSVTSHIISIRLLGYEYPPATQEGATSAPPSLVGAFRFLWELLRDQKNKSATSAEIYRLTFGEEPPEYGFLGRTAKAVGGWGRMIELFWQLATARPSGDVLGYVMKMGKGQDRSNGHRREATLVTGMSEAQKRLQAVALSGVGEELDGRSE